MTQEDKQLLIQEICARSPYKVKVQIDFGEHCIKYGIDRYVDDTVICVWPETFEVGVNDEDQACDIEDVKPYLRPLSSMTDEERAEMGTAIQKDRIEPYGEIKNFGEDNLLLCTIRQSTNLQDWLNKHHFDYRGLIPMGLALEAPEEMYKKD